MELKIYNKDGNVAGEMETPNFLSVKWNPSLVHQVFKAMAANRRNPIAHAKGRGEVSGGGIKPWKQKGTGRARQGSIRSPLWRHGGKSHGPVNTKDYSQKINKKMSQTALRSALTKKLANEELKVLNLLELEDWKTKKVAPIINNFAGGKSVLVVVANDNLKASRALKNLKKVMVSQAKDLNLYDVLNNKYVVLEQKALTQINADQNTAK